MHHRTTALFYAGALALFTGGVYYGLCREAPPPLINVLFPEGPLHACGDGATNTLPSLFHVLGFSLITTALLDTPGGNLARRAAIAAVLWLALDALFEGLSLMEASSLALLLPKSLAERLAAGTFDPLDLAAAALGAALALGISIPCRNPRPSAINDTGDNAGNATS